MRFILNFIFYGILFYLIYLAFPEAFFTLVSWADKLAEVVKDLYLHFASQVQDWRGGQTSSTHPSQALFFLANF